MLLKKLTGSSAIAETPRCKVRPFYCQKWKTIFCRQYRSIFNHSDARGLQSYRIRWNKAK